MWYPKFAKNLALTKMMDFGKAFLGKVASIMEIFVI